MNYRGEASYGPSFSTALPGTPEADNPSQFAQSNTGIAYFSQSQDPDDPNGTNDSNGMLDDIDKLGQTLSAENFRKLREMGLFIDLGQDYYATLYMDPDSGITRWLVYEYHEMPRAGWSLGSSANLQPSVALPPLRYVGNFSLRTAGSAIINHDKGPGRVTQLYTISYVMIGGTVLSAGTVSAGAVAALRAGGARALVFYVAQEGVEEAASSASGKSIVVIVDPGDMAKVLRRPGFLKYLRKNTDSANLDELARSLDNFAAPESGVRIFSSRTSSEIAQVTGNSTSVRQVQQKLGRAGLIDSSKVRIVRAAASEVPDVPGMKFYGWITQTGRSLLRDGRGRVIIKLTDDALESLEQAIRTVGHEMHHIKEVLSGAGASEAAADAAGKLLFERYLKHLLRGGG